MDKCDECGGKVETKKTPFLMYGEVLGKFEAFVCSGCGQKLFTEEVSQKIDVVAKRKGLWGLESHTRVGQAGDSLIIRVNKKLAMFLGLKKGEDVTLIPENKKKVIISI
jgi:hypothetical protein